MVHAVGTNETEVRSERAIADVLQSIASPAAVPEGNSGSTGLILTVTLDKASGKTTTVGFSTSAGTATAGSDYTAASGTIPIPAGQTTGMVTVNVLGDVLDFK